MARDRSTDKGLYFHFGSMPQETCRMFSGCAVQTDEDGCKSGGCSGGEFPRTKAKVTVQALIGGDGGEEPKGGKWQTEIFFTI